MTIQQWVLPRHNFAIIYSSSFFSCFFCSATNQSCNKDDNSRHLKKRARNNKEGEKFNLCAVAAAAANAASVLIDIYNLCSQSIGLWKMRGIHAMFSFFRIFTQDMFSAARWVEYANLIWGLFDTDLLGSFTLKVISYTQGTVQFKQLSKANWQLFICCFLGPLFALTW